MMTTTKGAYPFEILSLRAESFGGLWISAPITYVADNSSSGANAGIRSGRLHIMSIAWMQVSPTLWCGWLCSSDTLSRFRMP